MGLAGPLLLKDSTPPSLPLAGNQEVSAAPAKTVARTLTTYGSHCVSLEGPQEEPQENENPGILRAAGWEEAAILIFSARTPRETLSWLLN